MLRHVDSSNFGRRDPFRIAVLGGDGIGPSVVEQAIKVLKAMQSCLPHPVELTEGLIGGTALAAVGVALPATTLELCRSSDAVLLGAVGDPVWDMTTPTGQGPAASLLRLRQLLGLYANLRPVSAPATLFDTSYLDRRALGDGVDLVIVRDMSAGLFFGSPRGRRQVEGPDGPDEQAFDTMTFTRSEVQRIAKVAFELAQMRRGRISSVDQANVLESSRLWRETVNRVAADYPDVEVEHLYVDNCANELSRKPWRFDVILTEGLFGGILSDQVAAVAGSIGMLPSASIGDGAFGIFEPVHGSAPKYAGLNRANPIGTIRALALLLRLGLGLDRAAEVIERAVLSVVQRGIRTYDIARDGSDLVGTEQMGDAIAAEVMTATAI